MTFNIRKLKIQLKSAKHARDICDTRSKEHFRLKILALEKALEMALQERDLRRMAA